MINSQQWVYAAANTIVTQLECNLYFRKPLIMVSTHIVDTVPMVSIVDIYWNKMYTEPKTMIKFLTIT
jgi:hypothetical protein